MSRWNSNLACDSMIQMMGSSGWSSRVIYQLRLSTVTIFEMSLDWPETKMILLEVEQLFSRDDDIKDINDIQKMQHEIDTYCANSLKDAKELIKGKMLSHLNWRYPCFM